MLQLWVFGAVLFSFQQAFAGTAGFIKSPMSQTKLVGDSAIMHCEVMGNPIPEVQWWFIEGDEPNVMASQLYEGVQHNRVHINTTYIQHGASMLLLGNLTFNDTGVYECRASNDPDRNALKRLPKVKWIRSQANVIVLESEWMGVEQQPTFRGCEALRFHSLPVYCSFCVPFNRRPITTVPEQKLMNKSIVCIAVIIIQLLHCLQFNILSPVHVPTLVMRLVFRAS